MRSKGMRFERRLILFFMVLALGACATPSVDEIREQAKQDFYALLRHTSTVLDQSANRQVVNAALTQANNLVDDSETIDIFGKVNFKKEVETLIVNLDTGVPELFSEANVVADIDDGKRFRVTARKLCAILKEEDLSTTTCDAKHEQVSVDFDVTIDGDTVRVSVALAGQPIFASLTVGPDRVIIDVDGKTALAAVNYFQAKTGEELVEIRDFGGTWRVDWRRDGAGVVVESTLDNAALALDVVAPDGKGGDRNAVIDLRIKNATAKATLSSGKASVEGSITPTTIDFPHRADNLHLESSPLFIRVSADGSQKVEATLRATGTPSATLKFNGKLGIAAALDRGGAGEWKLRTEQRAQRSVLTLLSAVKPSLEIHPEVIDANEKPLTLPKVEGEFSANLTVARPQPSKTADPLLEIVGGSAKLTSGPKTLELKAGNCLVDADPSKIESVLDHLALGKCQ